MMYTRHYFSIDLVALVDPSINQVVELLLLIVGLRTIVDHSKRCIKRVY
jgi:hypothetical protein